MLTREAGPDQLEDGQELIHLELSRESRPSFVANRHVSSRRQCRPIRMRSRSSDSRRNCTFSADASGWPSGNRQVEGVAEEFQHYQTVALHRRLSNRRSINPIVQIAGPLSTVVPSRT